MVRLSSSRRNIPFSLPFLSFRESQGFSGNRFEPLAGTLPPTGAAAGTPHYFPREPAMPIAPEQLHDAVRRLQCATYAVDGLAVAGCQDLRKHLMPAVKVGLRRGRSALFFWPFHKFAYRFDHDGGLICIPLSTRGFEFPRKFERNPEAGAANYFLFFHQRVTVNQLQSGIA
jgi:hypothetical protein